MPTCPLYKSLKKNGTSFYAFPGAAEDISASYQNQNYKMYFSKYILLNFPKQNIDAGTNSNPVLWDFDNSFYRNNTIGQIATTYQDELIDSLRNYVANHEVTIKNSRLNNTEYYYDNTSLETTTEKIFWKWCKKLNLVDFEPAVDGDEYFGNLIEFERGNANDDTYFPEILWKEREVIDYSIVSFDQSAVAGYTSNLQIEFSTLTNYKVGDKILLSGISNTTPSLLSLNETQCNIVYMIDADSINGQRAVVDITPYSDGLQAETTGITTLVYQKLVQYIGEVNGVNNVQAANRSYTEVYAHIPDHTGQTPDILFRTITDVNYKPGMYYPILPSQYQPEILGAELFSSPIVNNPQAYPGNYYGQFDTTDYTYKTADGDSIRRSGDYYGIQGDINVPIVDGSTIDGINIDFTTSHYVKMNIIGRELTSFEQFNALEVNNEPPKDFEFNAILWYYTVEDVNGNSATNLYGISFLDNPDNNPVESEVGIRLPVYKKLAANDTQDGTSYAFSLNLNFNIINDNPQDSYNPNAINSLFSFNLFNEAMRRLSSTSDSFNKIIGEQTDLKLQLNNVKQLIYTQTDFATINKKIANLETLLKLYQYTQLITSDTIEVTSDTSSNPPYIKLNNKDFHYNKIDNINTTDLYNQSGTIPTSISVPTNKNFMVRVSNNDQTVLTLPNNDKLTIYLDRDLDYKQSFDLIVDSVDYATQNKQLEIFINYSDGQTNSLPVITKLMDTIDLPIYYNSYLQTTNSAKNWDRFDFEVDLSSNIDLNLNGILSIPLTGTTQVILNNSIKKGDTLSVQDFIVGTSSVINLSGQYTVDSVSTTTLYINLDITNNPIVTSYGETNITSGVSTTLNSILANKPYITLNKGVKYRVTRVDADNTSSFIDRYLIENI
jgi:hypothetical protein